MLISLSAAVSRADLVYETGLSIAPLTTGGWQVADSAHVTGSGHLDTANDPQSPLFVEGVVAGSSILEPVVLTGYVKGAGTFDNVVFDGTFSPGHSPTLVTVGSVIYSSSNTLIMELGGLLAGSQHDKIVHTGASLAGGTLDVVLINSFVPQLGNTFDLFDWNGGVTGAFSPIQLPALSPGLAWNTSDLLVGGTLSVVPEPSSLWFFGCSGIALLGGCKLRRVCQAYAG